MAVTVQDRGRYELFETTKGHRILVLDDERWFAWVEGQRGAILVRSDSDHERDHTIQEGEFLLVDFEHDRQFKDMPHLFLQEGDSFREVMLPNGLPNDDDVQKKVVGTDETIGVDELKQYLEDPEAGEGEERMDRPGGGSMANVTHHLRGIDFPAEHEDLIRHAREQNAPEAVIRKLREADRDRYDSMADVMKALGGTGEDDRSGRGEAGGSRAERELPIPNFAEMSVREAKGQLEDLSDEELRRLREFEEEHKQRKTLLKEIDRRLD